MCIRDRLYTTDIKAQELYLGSPESVGMSHDRIQNLTSVLNEYIENKKLAGAVALIARRGKIVYFESVGQMDIEKNIPIGGGLGGGSSNAAAALIGTNVLFQLGLSSENLREIGVKLGADVPFFIYGKNSSGRGIGEKLKFPLSIFVKVKLGGFHMVKLKFPIAVPFSRLFISIYP